MTNIDIITLTGLTTVDGSEIPAGGIIKIETVFPIGFAGFRSRVVIFRDSATFESGFEGILLYGITYDEFVVDMGAEFFDITPTILYTKVSEELNAFYGGIVCEVEITN